MLNVDKKVSQLKYNSNKDLWRATLGMIVISLEGTCFTLALYMIFVKV